ncbi:MAG: DUF3006 domain-containing protein [Clostridiaceae bacterium]|nr:DUF3006 domain-containing protein [Clostridiaceae bacterium]
MRLIIDRFEGDYAICETENKGMINIERSNLPCEAKEGDVIIKALDGYKIDKDETNKRKARINELMDDLWA